MIVAEVHIVVGTFGDRQMLHVVKFSDLAKARSEYERVAAFMKQRANRENDLPKIIELNGEAGCQTSVPLDHVTSVGLSDLVLANDQAHGMRDAYPNLFKV